MKKKWIRIAIIGAVIFGGLTSVNAHSLYRTFNIKPFSTSTTSTYDKTDSSQKLGVSLTQAGTEEVRDTINFSFKTNGVTVYTVNVTEGESKTKTQTSYGSTVSVTFKDNDYNLGGHTVKGTLYW